MRVRSSHLLLPRLRFSRLPWVFGLWLAAWVTPAHGQAPERGETSLPEPFVFGDVDCPDPKTVQQAVLSLIPPERHSLLSQGVRVELEDLGDTYRVTVWKDGAAFKKNHSDPARECDRRARFAAVFTVLTLMPPELGAEPRPAEPDPKPQAEPPPVVTPAPVKPRAPAQVRRLVPLARLELSALYSYAPAILDAPSMHSFGAELRAAIGRGPVSGTVSVGYATPAKFEVDSVQGDVTRIPLSVGVRLRKDFESWTVAGDVGVLLIAQRVRATNLVTNQEQSAADIGMRGGLQLAHPFGVHVAPFVGAFVWFSPGPGELSALPRGVIGNLPYFWFGGAVGLSFGL